MRTKKSYNNRNLTMQGINLPDKKKIRNLTDPKFRGSQVNKTAEEIFEGDKFRKRGDFDSAIVNYDDRELAKKKKAEQLQKEEDIANFKDFEDSFIKKQREELSHKKGKLSRMRKNAIIYSSIAFAALIFFLFFFPPIMSSQADFTNVLYNDNIFETMGLEEYKAYAQANYSVYNEKAFSSENSKSYRTVILCFSVHNLSPFELEIPRYEVLSADAHYDDKICYAGHRDNDDDADTIAPFGTQEVYVKVLINVSDMNDEQFTDAVDSLVISTGGMRKLLGSIKIPCVPSAAFVSDDITVKTTRVSAFTANTSE